MFEDSYLESKFTALLGPLRELMNDARTADVMVNPDGKVFIERIGEQIEPTDLVLPPAQTLAMIKTLATVTGSAKVHDDAPALAVRVPGLGWRFQGFLPPIVSGPAISLRKPAGKVYPLSDYVASGRLTEAQHTVLLDAVRERLNVVIVGGTGSGKTTFANALLHEVAQATSQDRIVTIEDTEELQCASANLVQLRTSRAVDMHDLLRWTLRIRPDRIVVGEVRGAEALVVLKAWNTGHPGGLTTLHANGAPEGLEKLEKLAAEGTRGFVPRSEVAAGVQIVVACERRHGQRRVSQVIRVEGLDREGNYRWKEIGT